MDPIRFTIRYWDPAKGAGLAVVDVPQRTVGEAVDVEITGVGRD